MPAANETPPGPAKKPSFEVGAPAAVGSHHDSLDHMDLEVVTERIDHETAVVAITGALRLSTDLHDVNNTLQVLIVDGVTRMVLDLTDCPYVDSAGLGTLLHTFGLLSERHGQLRLCGVNQRVEDLIVMTHTDALLYRDISRQDSLDALPLASDSTE